MLAYKRFSVFMIPALLLSSAQVHAGPINCILNLFRAETAPSEQVDPSGVKFPRKDARQEYRKFLLARNKGAATPPVERFESGKTQPGDLFLGFGFWWFPGNIWNGLMTQEYGDQAREIQRQAASEGAWMPAQMPPEYHGLIEVPESLPAIQDAQPDPAPESRASQDSDKKDFDNAPAVTPGPDTFITDTFDGGSFDGGGNFGE